jgi:hypothetical protein
VLLEAEMFRWPKFAGCLRSQLSNYDPARDRAPSTSKLPQDLVAMMAMAAFVIRRWFNSDVHGYTKAHTQDSVLVDLEAHRPLRLDRGSRTRRDRSFRPRSARVDDPFGTENDSQIGADGRTKANLEIFQQP